MTDIKAIPTTYNGIKYRSRTEARWALFFDFAGIKFEYEQEKLFTGYSTYIPDFTLNLEITPYGGKCLFEVKGKEATMAEKSKVFNAAGQDGVALIASGPLDKYKLERLFDCEGQAFFCQTGRFNQCLYCGAVGFQGSDVGFQEPQELRYAYDRLDFHECEQREFIHRVLNVKSHFWYHLDIQSPPCPESSPMIQLALRWAQNARFESSVFYEQLEDQKSTLKLLKDNAVFGSTGFALQLAQYASYAIQTIPRLRHSQNGTFRPQEEKNAAPQQAEVVHV
jgi:hypothetical protein